MSNNSQYMRSVNDYSLSAHELFTGAACVPHPTETRVFIIKHIPDVETINAVKDELLSEIRKHTPNLTKEKQYNISYRDAVEADLESYTIYGQTFLVRKVIDKVAVGSGIFVDDRKVVVAEIYRRSNELILILLSNTNLDWADSLYESIQNRYEEQEEDLANTFFTIGRNHSGFELQSMELTTVFDENVITNNYNDSFRETWELTIGAIDNDESGLILLHGIAGSGKSNVLKQIIARGGKRKIVYIPSYLATSLSDPSFIGFVRTQMSNAVLVIEDGEDVLVSRDKVQTPATSNILQISDGILGDALNILIISTFNTDLANIDTALQRKGRMIAEYKFGELDIDKAQNLVTNLFGEDNNLLLPTELTLANLFTLDKHQPKTVVKPKGRIGF